MTIKGTVTHVFFEEATNDDPAIQEASRNQRVQIALESTPAIVNATELDIHIYDKAQQGKFSEGQQVTITIA